MKKFAGLLVLLATFSSLPALAQIHLTKCLSKDDDGKRCLDIGCQGTAPGCQNLAENYLQPRANEWVTCKVATVKTFNLLCSLEQPEPLPVYKSKGLPPGTQQ